MILCKELNNEVKYDLFWVVDAIAFAIVSASVMAYQVELAFFHQVDGSSRLSFRCENYLLVVHQWCSITLVLDFHHHFALTVEWLKFLIVEPMATLIHLKDF